MAFKFIILAALVAVAQCGAPVAYNIGTASADYSSVAYAQESTQKGYGGQNVITSYSKSVNSPYSSVQVSNERVSNDGPYLTHTIQPATYAAHVAPVLAKTYAAPILAKTAYAAPAIATYTQGAPLVAKSYVAPALTTYAHATPAVATYAQAAPVFTKTYAAAPAYTTLAHSAPVIAKTVQTSPIYGYAATAAHAPVVHATFTGIGANYAW